jgi:hypothetical protein
MATSTLYALSLQTLEWALLWPPSPSSPSSPSPTSASDPGSSPSSQPRYYHSASAHGAQLLVFGGERPAAQFRAGGGTRELADLWIWDTVSRHWEQPRLGVREGVKRPTGRFAHLSLVDSLFVGGGPALFVIGGSGRAGRELAILDLEGRCWVHNLEDVGRTLGACGSVIVNEAMELSGGKRKRGWCG